MKRTVLIVLVLLFSLQLFADNHQQAINLERKGRPRDGFPVYFDIPAAYHDIKNHEIIIDGGGAVSYYDVVISSATTNTVEISTTVDGTYDTFDISSLAPGSHVITIESPSGNIYEGTFTVY